MDYILNHKTMYGNREKKEIELMRVNSYVKGAEVKKSYTCTRGRMIMINLSKNNDL